MSIRINLEPKAGRCTRDFILCYWYHKPASVIHLCPDGDGGWEVLPACGECDPGGYWLPLGEFARQPLPWLVTLADVDSDQALTLLRWAGAYLKALERVAAGGSAGITEEVRRAWGLRPRDVS